MPTRRRIHIDRALTNISVAYIQNANNFIADKVFPIVPVKKQSDTFFKYSKDDFFRDEAAVRAKGAESVGGDYSIEQAEPYFCKKYAYHMDVTEDDRVNADNPLRPNQDAAEFVTQKLLIKREVEWASNFFVSDVWGREVTGVNSNPTADQAIKFNLATSDPIKVITDEATRMAENTGFKPNTLVLSPYVFAALKNHEEILNRIKYTQKGIVTTDLLATLFEVDNVYIPWGVKNTTKKGATGSNSFIMGKHALLCYVNPTPSLKKPSAGYIFAWKGLKGAGAFGNRIVRIPMPWLGMDTERTEGEMAFDAKVIASDLGIFFKDIVD